MFAKQRPPIQKKTIPVKFGLVLRLVCIVVLQLLVTLFAVASSQISSFLMPTITGVWLLLVKNYAGKFDATYQLTQTLLSLCVALHLYLCHQYGWGYHALGENFLYLMGLFLATGAGAPHSQ
jgi:hypothetical protein